MQPAVSMKQSLLQQHLSERKNAHPETISAPYCLVAAIQSFVVKGRRSREAGLKKHSI